MKHFSQSEGRKRRARSARAGFVREKKVQKTFFVSSAYGQCPSGGANFFLHFSDDNWHPDCSKGAESRRQFKKYRRSFLASY